MEFFMAYLEYSMEDWDYWYLFAEVRLPESYTDRLQELDAEVLDPDSISGTVKEHYDGAETNGMAVSDVCFVGPDEILQVLQELEKDYSLIEEMEGVEADEELQAGVLACQALQHLVSYFEMSDNEVRLVFFTAE